MSPISPEIPRTSKRHHTRSSTSSGTIIRGSNGNGKISKQPSQKAKVKRASNVSKPKSRCEAARTRAKVQQTMISIAGGSLISDPPSFSSSEMPEDTSDTVPDITTASNSQIKEMMVPDAVEEPIGQETSQYLNENDKKLSEFTVALTKSKLDRDQQDTQFVRRICILYDGDPFNEKAAIRKAMVDTGSQHSLTFESHMKKLEIHFQRFEEAMLLYSVESRPFRVIGRREILFRYRERKHVHTIDLYVLEDPPENMKPSFDILLGREHIIPAKVVQINRDVAGDAFLVLDRRPGARV